MIKKSGHPSCASRCASNSLSYSSELKGDSSSDDVDIKEDLRPEQMPLKHPQEIEVWYIIPAIRKELAADLVKKGNSQRQVAKILGITESAVSQYIKKKRANDFALPKEVKDFIKKAANKIKDEKTAYRQIQEISKFIRDSKALCKIHLLFEKEVSSCNVCYE